MTSNRVYRWRLILEEDGPEIIYIKGIHNTVADAISRLNFSPKAPSVLKEERNNWMILTKCWNSISRILKSNSEPMEINHVFATRSDEEDIYPLTVIEIAEAQKTDKSLQQLRVSSKYETMLIENTKVLCKMAN